MAIVGLLGSFAFGAAAQTPAPPLDAIKARLDLTRQTFERLPPKHQALVDGYSHPVHLSRVFDKLAQRISSAQGSKRALLPREPGKALAEADPNVSVVNDPSTDLDFSLFDGLTQSETHTAMCGNQVVVGFNDTGSFLQTNGLSISGAAVSSDRGRTFRDIGALTPPIDISDLN